MPSLDCPVCEGSGYVQVDGGESTICARCDGTGVVFVDGGAGDVPSDDRG
jgi:DnaJ-class molecular chaperone